MDFSSNEEDCFILSILKKCPESHFLLEKTMTHCLEITLEWVFTYQEIVNTERYTFSSASHRFPGISIFKTSRY